jgi:hypothetical protein
MKLRETIGTLLSFFVCVGWACAQSASSAPASVPASETVVLTVPRGTPLQIALQKEVRVRKTGQALRGRLVQPVYAFDRLVIPAGTEVTGHIAKIDPVPGKQRTLAILNADFTPTRRIQVDFDDLALPDGKHIPLHTVVTPGSGQVIRLLSAGEHQKNKPVQDAAAQKMQAAKQEWQNAMQQIKQPGKFHRMMRLGFAQLPVRPQYIDAGTLYFAELQEPLEFGSETLTAKALSAVGTTPPPGSLAHALLITPLDSATSRKGSDVEALLSQPLLDGKQLILPQGSRLKGSVLQVRPARYFHHNGQLRITFHELILPSGTARRVETTIQGIQAGAANNAKLDTEGGVQASSPKSMYLSTGISVGLAWIGSGGKRDVGLAGPVSGGATAFKLIGITVGLIVRSHTIGILMSAYGGGRAIYSTFIGRGHNLAFPKNTVMEIGFGNSAATPMPVGH